MKTRWSIGLLTVLLLTGVSGAVPVLAQERANPLDQAAQSCKQGDMKAAERYYRQALLASPGHPQATLGLASVLSNQGRDAEARGLLEELTRQQPGFQPAYYLLGILYERQGQMDLARQTFKHYVDLGAGNIPPDPHIRIKLRQFGVL